MLSLPAAAPASAGAAPQSTESATPSLVLVTLDTTRADALGSYSAEGTATPALDALAAAGTRYATAVAPSPLTLPAHASLLTGLEPPEHGLRDNGVAVLDPALPTLASLLAARGYSTAAFVASRVLDHRFGLDTGFELYGDGMTAERVGEYGYAERDARAVTDAAVAWLAELPSNRPYFLWVHYYDPHAPYAPPPRWRADTEKESYAGEVSYMDGEIGRLLAALPAGAEATLIAVVGDHGESLGEHGERRHGLFLYRAALEVPLILAGPGVPRGRVVGEVVATRRLPATLLGLLGAGGTEEIPGPSLPGLSAPGAEDPSPQPVYSETWMPANSFGWSPLEALTDQRWRLIAAPRPELYDLRADPGETHNLISELPAEAGRLAAWLDALRDRLGARPAAEPHLDPDLAADLRSLGYLSGSRSEPGTIDPKDGVAMLAELDRAKRLLAAGETARAVVGLRDLVRRSPDNVPFLTGLGAAELAAGNGEEAIAAHRRAVALNPRLEFLHLHLADTYLRLGRREEARRELEATLELDPRSARAWLLLGELAHHDGDGARERRLLEEAVAVGTTSAAIRARLGQLAAAAGDLASAEEHLRVATALAPGWALPWLLWGENAEARMRAAEAEARYRRAVELEPGNEQALLRLGRLLLGGEAAAEGRDYLERAVALAPQSGEGREARRLLAAPPG